MLSADQRAKFQQQFDPKYGSGGVSDLDSGVDLHSNVTPTTFSSNNFASLAKNDNNHDDDHQLIEEIDFHDSQQESLPRPLPVILTDEETHTFTLVDQALSSILLRQDVADLKVCIVSVAGAFRKGKSFLLNFFLRYLSHFGAGKNGEENLANFINDDDWLGNDDRNLEGFSWRGGCERETSGMLLWSEPFFAYSPSGEKIAILLMDTQGAFDSQSTVKDCATVFALSTMISSVQIYNLSQNIQEDDLQHLQLFTEYGRLALESNDSKPFQNLIFLIRDWSFPYEADYGLDGGQKILDRRLQVSDKQHAELQQLRKYIRNCFTGIECFLMPHPGLKVATSPNFKGQLSNVESEFKTQLKNLIPNIVDGSKLTLKEINGEKVTCRELLEYFRSYIKIFQGEELPEPKSMLLATAEANNLAAVASAKANYCKKMEEICGGDSPYVAVEFLEAKHCQFRDDCLHQFNKTRKMGGEEFSKSFLEKLDVEISERYENFVKNNNGKNFFRSARTPGVLFVFLVFDYLLQEIFQLLYLDFLATLCSTILGLILMTMCLWFYTRYTGSFREIGKSIDEVTEFCWDNILSPFSYYALQESVKHAASLQRKFNETNASNGSASNLHRKGTGRR